MANILKALEQMQRGMSSPEGRAAVNAETATERAGWQKEWEERQKEINTSQAQAMSDAEFMEKMQSGIFGKLD